MSNSLRGILRGRAGGTPGNVGWPAIFAMMSTLVLAGCTFGATEHDVSIHKLGGPPMVLELRVTRETPQHEVLFDEVYSMGEGSGGVRVGHIGRPAGTISVYAFAGEGLTLDTSYTWTGTAPASVIISFDNEGIELVKGLA